MQKQEDTYWLSPGVPAFLSECLLVQPRIVSVPREEVPCEVNREGLVDMRRYKVVEPGLCARDDLRRGARWLRREALYCFNIVQPLLLCESAPDLESV